MLCHMQVQRLVDAGANVNEPSTGPKSPGGTPLHLAAAGGHIDVMDELLERGADIDVRTKGGCGCEYFLHRSLAPNQRWLRIVILSSHALFRCPSEIRSVQ